MFISAYYVQKQELPAGECGKQPMLLTTNTKAEVGEAEVGDDG